tara:strand:- start:7 stop:384 length:378 start_codon:yes stop_codon:yes gene_type:complete
MIQNSLKTTVLLALGAFVLTACESPENRAAREAQFNGQPLNAVIAQIGKPSAQTADKVVWSFKETETQFTPVYRYNQYGQAILVGHNRQNLTFTCTYTARLNAGRVVESHYEGNSCMRFAPKLGG